MPYSSVAEAYFIAIMMFLIVVLCSVSSYFFFRQFKREKEAKAERLRKKQAEKEQAQTSQVE